MFRLHETVATSGTLAQRNAERRYQDEAGFQLLEAAWRARKNGEEVSSSVQLRLRQRATSSASANSQASGEKRLPSTLNVKERLKETQPKHRTCIVRS